MSRNLVLLNLLLAALIGLVGWRLWGGYQETKQRQVKFVSSPVPAAPAPVVSIPPPPGQVSAGNYFEIASRLLFSRDRNPTVVVEVPAPKPMPVLPRFYGLMNFGAAPKVILAPAAGAPQKSYLAGETIGEFKLVTIGNDGLVFEWDGKTVTSRYEDLRDTRGPAEQQTASAAAAPSPSPAAPVSGGAVTTVTSVSSSSAQGPSNVEVGDNLKGCQAGDNSPAGTIVDGYRKVIVKNPFGGSCRWEKVN